MAQDVHEPFNRLFKKHRVSWQQVRISDDPYLILPMDELQDTVYSHAEFVWTDPTPHEINPDTLPSYILKILRTKVIRAIRTLLDRHPRRPIVFEVLNKEDRSASTALRRTRFPYTSFLHLRGTDNDAVLLFTNDDDYASHYRFVFQCTLGIPLTSMIEVVNILSTWCAPVMSRKASFMLETARDRADRALTLYHWDRPQVIRNYVFLLVYSWMSGDDSLSHTIRLGLGCHTSRKTGSPFILRHAWHGEMPALLTSDERQQIVRLFTHTRLNTFCRSSHNEIRYENHQRPTQQQIRAQQMTDVSCPKLPTLDSILFEWRLLDAMLKKTGGLFANHNGHCTGIGIPQEKQIIHSHIIIYL